MSLYFSDMRKPNWYYKTINHYFDFDNKKKKFNLNKEIYILKKDDFFSKKENNLKNKLFLSIKNRNIKNNYIFYYIYLFFKFKQVNVVDSKELISNIWFYLLFFFIIY